MSNSRGFAISQRERARVMHEPLHLEIKGRRECRALG
jgi:hypothetical protein